MQSLIKITRYFRNKLATLNCPVYHYHAEPAEDTHYVVWAESQEGQPFYTNDKKKEQSIEGYLEFYTQEEFDEICDNIQEILYEACDAWQLDFVEYLDNEKVLRFTWHWKIRG